MKTILFLLRKEFLQIFRNRVIVAMIFVMPIIQLLILANAADYEVRNLKLQVVDQDHSSWSRQLVGHFSASPYFELTGMVASAKKGITAIEADEADLVLHIPPGFERTLRREETVQVHLNINAINGVKAGLAGSYAQAIIRDLNQEIMPVVEQPGGLSSTFRYWYNPDMDYYTFMVPGILVLLVTLVGMFLSGLNIVKEKEIGTIEQINVSPIRKYQFIIGKLLPFWLIAQVELALGLMVGWLVFDIPIVGSLGVVFAFSSIYLLVVLGMGLLVSTITDTQQQAMFISWFFLVIFILMSGLFTPIESMPGWARQITRLNPVAYFVEVVRLVLLKGSSWWDIRSQWIALSIFAVVINGAAILNYRKTD